VSIDVHSQEERDVQEYIDTHLSDPERRSPRSGSSADVGPLLQLMVWACARVVLAALLAGVPTAVALLRWHHDVAVQGGPPWVVMAMAPIAAWWLGRRWARRRHLGTVAVTVLSVVYLGATFVAGMVAEAAIADRLTEEAVRTSATPAGIWFGTWVIATAAAVPTMLASAIVIWLVVKVKGSLDDR